MARRELPALAPFPIDLSVGGEPPARTLAASSGIVVSDRLRASGPAVRAVDSHRGVPRFFAAAASAKPVGAARCGLAVWACSLRRLPTLCALRLREPDPPRMTSDALCRGSGPAAGSPSRVGVSSGPTYVGLAEHATFARAAVNRACLRPGNKTTQSAFRRFDPWPRGHGGPHPARCSIERSRYPAPVRVLQSRSSPSDGHELLTHATPLNSRDVVDGRSRDHR